MEEFRRGQVQLLLSTTMVEVGVDVPQATAMVIESAERFGLAQLHQLRGRVGRGETESWCTAVHGRLTPSARRRLEVFAATTDGFRIAEEDLRLRGPGELLGKLQSGPEPLRIASLVRDGALLRRAHADAREMAWEGGLGRDALARLSGEEVR